MPDRRPSGSPPIPVRTVRVPDALWRRCQAVAAARNETVSSVINRMLRRYALAEDLDEMSTR